MPFRIPRDRHQGNTERPRDVFVPRYRDSPTLPAKILHSTVRIHGRFCARSNFRGPRSFGRGCQRIPPHRSTPGLSVASVEGNLRVKPLTASTLWPLASGPASHLFPSLAITTTKSLSLVIGVGQCLSSTAVLQSPSDQKRCATTFSLERRPFSGGTKIPCLGS